MPNISDQDLLQNKNRIENKLKLDSNIRLYFIVCIFLTLLDFFENMKNGVFMLDWVFWIWIGWGIPLALKFWNIQVQLKKEIDKPD